jgi:ankyrin repeat protein
MIGKLLQKGANQNHADEPGRTALLIATQNGNRDVVELLLKNGADHTREDSQTRTPLRLAAANGDRALVEMFLTRSDKGEHLATEFETPTFSGLVGAGLAEQEQGGRRLDSRREGQV